MERMPDMKRKSAGSVGDFLHMHKKIIYAIVLILILLASVFIAPRLFLSEDNITFIRDTLGERQRFVTQLSLVTASLSVGLSALPGDFATPIANELANLTSYFILIFALIAIQRVAFTILGYITFYVLIPLACVIGLTYLSTLNKGLLVISIKTAIFGLAIFAVIPLSVIGGNFVHHYFTNEYEEEFVMNFYIPEVVEYAAEEIPVPDDDEDAGIFQRAWNSVIRAASNVGDAVTGVVANVAGDITAARDAAVNAFNRLIRDIGIQLATSVAIPFLTMLLMFWLVRVLFSFDVYLLDSTKVIRRSTNVGLLKAGMFLKKKMVKK